MFENELITEYKRLWDHSKFQTAYFKIKESGIPVPPSIPFVGVNYSSSPLKTLVYGSAENLTYLNDGKPHNISEWTKTHKLDLVMNRHRAFFHSENQNMFFNDIHMKPANDGSLLIVARKILEMCKANGIPEQPTVFLESICIANFGKFSIQAESKNFDGAGSVKYLNDSLPYALTDIRILKPDLIILPASIFKRVKTELIAEAKSANSNVRFAKIMQTNARVINCHLKKKTTGEYKLSGLEQKWTENCKLNMKVYLDWISKNWSSIIESI